MMTSPAERFALTHFYYFDDRVCHKDKAVIIQQGRIAAIVPAQQVPFDLPSFDCQGQLLAPGFIDTQVNGGGGVMFNEQPTLAGIETIRRAHWSGGTTSLLPTLITDQATIMQEAVMAVEQAIVQLPGIVGIHLEGPHLSLDRRGVHSPDYIRPFDAVTEQLLERLKPEHYLLTVAPERLPAGTIQALVKRGIRVNAGHTTATYNQMLEAIAEGLTGITHLYNAMTPITSREPGVVGAALEADHLYCGIIIDHFHIHPTVAKLAIQQKARGTMLLVTDAMATVGSEENSFRLYGETIYAQDGRCAKADGTLAGSALDMATAVRNCAFSLGIDLDEALRMASLYPARYMGIDHHLGKIAEGYAADLVVLDDALQVQQTWLRGELCFSRL